MTADGLNPTPLEQTWLPFIAEIESLEFPPTQAESRGVSPLTLDNPTDQRTLLRVAYNTVRRLVGPDDAQDIAGEAMARLLAWPVPPDNPAAWITLTARRIAVDQVRRREAFKAGIEPALKAEQVRSLGERVFPVDTSPSAGDRSRIEGHEILEAAIRLLPARQEQAITLYYYERLRYKVIAQRMGISQETVKTHLQRGLQQLRAYFEQNGLEKACE